MTLVELQAEVIILTNRPDLVAMTLSAVKSATLKAHQSDFYPRDIYETGVSFATAEYEHDFEVTTFIPLFRAIKFARIYDNVGNTPLQLFDIISPENVLDSYAQARTDVCYLGGAEIHFKAAATFQYILFGCYVNPNLVDIDYNSWIASYHPWAIIYEAAAIVFRATGNTEKFASMRDLAKDEYRNLMVNNIQAVGY
jgi:hypothetical protein